MSRRLLLASLLTALCAAPFAACGSAENRPVVIATFPATGTTLPGLVSEIEVTYDEAVTVLNPDDAFVTAGGSFIAVRIHQRPGVPCCIYLRPLAGFSFLPELQHVVRLGQGAVVNQNLRYSLDEVFFSFNTGPLPDFGVGSPGAVTLLDARTFVSGGTTTITEAAPASHTPVGIAGVELAAASRYFVQNRNAVAPGVSPLHFFSPGDAGTTAVTLTDGTDLRAEADTISMARSGTAVLAAFTHLPSQRIRLYAVDVVTGTEIGFLVLSPAANAANMALGLDIGLIGDLVFITCRDGADGQLVYVNATDVTALTELDRDAGTPGVQAAPLVAGLGAGPISHIVDRAVIADPASVDTTLISSVTDLAGLAISGPVVGTNVDVLTGANGLVTVQLLNGYADGMGLIQRRREFGYLDPTPLEVSDLVGAVSTGATGIAAGVRYAPSNRFLFILDSDVATVWFFNGSFMIQEDSDDVVDGIQGTDISGAVSGVTAVGRVEGQFAP